MSDTGEHPTRRRHLRPTGEPPAGGQTKRADVQLAERTADRVNFVEEMMRSLTPEQRVRIATKLECALPPSVTFVAALTPEERKAGSLVRVAGLEVGSKVAAGPLGLAVLRQVSHLALTATDERVRLDACRLLAEWMTPDHPPRATEP